MPKLKVLDLHGVAICTRRPDGVREDMFNLSMHHQLEAVRFKYVQGPLNIILPQSLKVWDCTAINPPLDLRPVSSQILPLPNVSELNMVECSHLEIDLLPYLRSPGGQSLKRLRLGHCWAGWWPNLLSPVLKNGPLENVTELSLVCEFLRDKDWQLFASGFPRLRDLSLTAANITGVFLVNLVCIPNSSLRTLQLTACGQVSPDTYGWLRTRGLTVAVAKSC